MRKPKLRSHHETEGDELALYPDDALTIVGQVAYQAAATGVFIDHKQAQVS